MKHLHYLLTVLFAGIILTSCMIGEHRKFELPAIINNNMVLQQNHEVALWGKAHPGSKVIVEASWNEKSEIKTARDSSWTTRLKTPPAGGPYTLDFINGDSTVHLENVMIGEVWIGSGQSNMEMPVMGWPPLDSILNSKNEIATANYPDIRLFTVSRAMSATTADSCDGQWLVCSPVTVGKFSATAYFFAKTLHRELGVPIGMIHSSWGGTPVESWMTREKMNTFAEFQPIIQKLDSSQSKIQELRTWLNARPILKIDQNAETPWSNLGFKDEEVPKVGFNDDQWKTTNLPNFFESAEIGQFDGAVWYRKFISIPEKWQGKELVLELGPIDDMDVTYFNGQLIGSNEIDGLWQKVRKYTISADKVKIGENLIAVRVLDIRGNGGLYGKAEDLKIYPANNVKDFISLSGEWKYLPVAILFNNNFRLLNIETQEFHQMPKLPLEIGPNTPTVLYNAMINPLVPYTIKGAIWYQGEANSGNPKLYTTLFPAMIESWRSVWQSGDFPFYFVQIAPYKYGEWADAAGLREAQFKTLRVPNTGMAVTLDIGNPDNIHPANKPEVGRRLALWALAKDYGKDQIYSGPLYSSMEINGNAIVVSFTYAEGGLRAKDGILKNFEIAGDDRIFHPAKAKIIGDKVMVQSSSVKKPVAVRYLWDNASEASLFNSAGLPASSFRTDDW